MYGDNQYKMIVSKSRKKSNPKVGLANHNDNNVYV